MFNFTCLFCNELMPLATKRGYHKTCVRAMREIQIPAFTIDTAWKILAMDPINEDPDNTTIDLDTPATYELSTEEDAWDAKTELITYTPRQVEELTTDRLVG